MIGDTVLVERAGDVIPYIVKPLAELRSGDEKKIAFPSNALSAKVNYLRKRVRRHGAV